MSLTLGGAPLASAEPPPASGWRGRPYLTGDWGGWRGALAERGVVPLARYTGGFWSNLRGGFQTGTRYEGFAEWGLFADLQPLVGWTGGSFEINWYSYHGGQPSEDLVGPFPTQTVSGWETEVSVRFYEILLRQEWGDGRFVFKLGQLTADEDFFLVENADALLNGTFGFLGLGREQEIAPFYPLAAPGAAFRARTHDRHWEMRVGVYTADPGSDDKSNFGFDWSFDDGVFLLAELRAERHPFGKTAKLAVGATYSNAKLEDLEGPGFRRGTYALYAALDLALLDETPSQPRLGLFLRGYGAPQNDRAALSWYVDAGLKLVRPFARRPRDVVSLGFAFLRLEDAFVASERANGVEITRDGGVLELTYRLQATGWLTLQPNLQLFFDPHLSRSDATAIGIRAVIEL